MLGSVSVGVAERCEKSRWTTACAGNFQPTSFGRKSAGPDLSDLLPTRESLLDLQIKAVRGRAESRAYDKKEEGRERIDDSGSDVSCAGRIWTSKALRNRPDQEADEEGRRVGEFSHETEDEAGSNRDFENPCRIDEESGVRGDG